MAERYGIEEYGRHMDLAVSALEKEKRLRQMAGNDSRPSRKERKKLARQGKEGGGQGKKQQGKGEGWKQQGKGEGWKQQGLVRVAGHTEGQRGQDDKGRDREREREWDRDRERRREGDREKERRRGDDEERRRGGEEERRRGYGGERFERGSSGGDISVGSASPASSKLSPAVSRRLLAPSTLPRVGGTGKGAEGGAKETPQERLKRLMAKQLNKHIKKDTAAEKAKKQEQERLKAADLRFPWVCYTMFVLPCFAPCLLPCSHPMFVCGSQEGYSSRESDERGAGEVEASQAFPFALCPFLHVCSSMVLPYLFVCSSQERHSSRESEEGGAGEVEAS
ncbi:unnamed protein product [Closterium sp. Yama58-4]|nr:unnamed protein product [Closterium sp. Yama58-4]